MKGCIGCRTAMKSFKAEYKKSKIRILHSKEQKKEVKGMRHTVYRICLLSVVIIAIVGAFSII